MSPKSTTFIVDKDDIVKFKAKGFAVDFSIGQWMFDNYDQAVKAVSFAVYDTLGFTITTKPFFADEVDRGVFIGKHQYDGRNGKALVRRMSRSEWKVVISACFAVRAALVDAKVAGITIPYNEKVPEYFKPETVTDGEYADFSLRG